MCEHKLTFMPKFKAIHADIKELDFDDALTALKKVKTDYIDKSEYKILLIDTILTDLEKYVENGFNLCTHDEQTYLFKNYKPGK